MMDLADECKNMGTNNNDNNDKEKELMILCCRGIHSCILSLYWPKLAQWSCSGTRLSNESRGSRGFIDRNCQSWTSRYSQNDSTYPKPLPKHIYIYQVIDGTFDHETSRHKPCRRGSRWQGSMASRYCTSHPGGCCCWWALTRMGIKMKYIQHSKVIKMIIGWWYYRCKWSCLFDGQGYSSVTSWYK